MKLQAFEKFGLSYELTARKRNAAGMVVSERKSARCPNLFTNNGIDDIGKNAITFFCVGTGNTPPTYTDVSLANFLAGITNGSFNWVSFSRTDLGNGKYELVDTRSEVFAVGAATGNIAEVGAAARATATPASATLLCSRALVVDGAGNPTTFTVQADEELQLTVFATKIVDYTDRVSSIVVNGVTYSVTARPIRLSFARATDNRGYPSTAVNSMGIMYGTVTLADPITGSASSTEGSDNTAQGIVMTTAPYVNGSKLTSYTLSKGTGLAKNIGGLSIGASITGEWQVKFDPTIPKTALQKFTCSFSLSLNQVP